MDCEGVSSLLIIVGRFVCDLMSCDGVGTDMIIFYTSGPIMGIEMVVSLVYHPPDPYQFSFPSHSPHYCSEKLQFRFSKTVERLSFSFWGDRS